MSKYQGKKILITGAAKRLGRSFAIAAAQQGAHIFLHYSSSKDQALQTQTDIQNSGGTDKDHGHLLLTADHHT